MCHKMCARSKTGETNTSDVPKNKQPRGTKKQTRKLIKEQAEGNRYVATTQVVPCPFPEPTTFYRDFLAIVTEKQRVLVWAVYDRIGKWQKTKSYKILFNTTQPAHVLMIMAVTTIAMLLNPMKNRSEVHIQPPSPFISLVYLSAFMMHFGAQMWMTFVSGLSLYFAVPRHTFGEVQQVLFPRYFGLNSFLSLITLVIFVKLHPTSTSDPHLALQVGAMAVCFLLELLIRLYLAPPLLRLIAAKIAMEKQAGVGLEVGRHDPGPLAKCPHYIKIHKAFRKVHMLIAIGNLVSMACTLLHLLYLANKLSVP